jgi:hypothetical protein
VFLNMLRGVSAGQNSAEQRMRSCSQGMGHVCTLKRDLGDISPVSTES